MAIDEILIQIPRQMQSQARQQIPKELVYDFDRFASCPNYH